VTVRAWSLVVALAACSPAVAQTRILSVAAPADIGEPLFAPRGNTVAAYVGQDRVCVWSLPDGKLVQTLELPDRPSAKTFAASGEELFVALRDGTIQVRAVGTGATVRQMKADRPQAALAATADGRLLASAAGERITVWDASGQVLRTFGHEFGDVTSLAFSPDRTVLASAGFDANVHLWDVSTGQRRATVPDQLVATFALTFTPDGKSLLAGGASGAIQVVDAATASVTRRFPPLKYAVSALSVSPDGRSLGAAYFDVDGTARPAPVAAWELESGRLARRATPGAPQAIGYGPDGQLRYALVKGPELTVGVIASSPAGRSGQIPRLFDDDSHDAVGLASLKWH
jgi:WD40 repeat protein